MYQFSDNPRLSKVINLDAVISHLVAIYSTTGFTTKYPQNDEQKPSNTSSNATNSSDSAVSDFSLSQTSNNSDMSIIIVPGSPEESVDEVTTDKEGCTELVQKLLDALEIVKECIL